LKLTGVFFSVDCNSEPTNHRGIQRKLRDSLASRFSTFSPKKRFAPGAMRGSKAYYERRNSAQVFAAELIYRELTEPEQRNLRRVYRKLYRKV